MGNLLKKKKEEKFIIIQTLILSYVLFRDKSLGLNVTFIILQKVKKLIFWNIWICIKGFLGFKAFKL